MLDILLDILAALSEVFVPAGNTLTYFLRFVFPILTAIILLRCAHSLFAFEPEPEIWGYLVLPNGDQIPITHWENVIGRARNSDLVVSYPTVSRAHAVLTRYDDGSWSIGSVGARGGIQVNGQELESLTEVQFGDVLNIGGVEMTLMPLNAAEEEEEAAARTRAGTGTSALLTLLLLTAFQVLTVLQLRTSMDAEDLVTLQLCFGALAALEWGLYIAMRLLQRTGYEVETIAFYLCTLGLAVVASATPDDLLKTIITIAMGMAVYVFLCWILQNLDRAKKFRYVMAAGGLLLLAVNLIFGTVLSGAQNWIQIGSLSFQPSELVKICFVFVGASTMDRLMSKRNVFLFIVYSAILCICLALMSDFGTALVFFVGFLVIAFMRSGSFSTIAMAITGTGFAAAMVVRFRPYVLSRFEGWRHVWEYSTDSRGYQQTRAMMCIASGGLFGLGAGNGWLKYVAAADTDLVFGLVAEEWGLLVAMMMVGALVLLGVFVVRSTVAGRSSFYSIGACAAVAMLLIQAILNVFGTIDFLPLTGVTFPFVSNGGSSMISAWGLLAFIKAADTRQNASLAIRLHSRRSRESRDDFAGYGSQDAYESSDGYDGYDGYAEEAEEA